MIDIDPVQTSGQTIIRFESGPFSGSRAHKSASALVGGPPALTESPRNRPRHSTGFFEKILNGNPTSPTDSCQAIQPDWDDHQEILLSPKVFDVHTDTARDRSDTFGNMGDLPRKDFASTSLPDATPVRHTNDKSNTKIQQGVKRRAGQIQSMAEAKAKRQETSTFAPNSPQTDLLDIEVERGDEQSHVPATQMESMGED